MRFLPRLSASFTALAALACAALPAAADQRWLLLSDIHLDPSAHYATLAPSGRDSDSGLLRSAIGAMKAADPNPQVVVLTGDFLAHHFDDVARRLRLSTDRAALGSMRAVATAFAAAFPHAHFLVALGNNDDPCGDYRASSRSPYLKALAAIWAPLVNRDSAAPAFARDFAQNGYYTSRLPGTGAHAVVLDSVLWSWRYAPCAAYAGNAGDDELRWLATTLAESPANQRNVVVMHVPPGVDAYSTALLRGIDAVPFFDARSNAAFGAILATNRTRIPFALAGHAHRNDFRLVEGVPLLIASSISPVYDNNPTFYNLRVAGDGALRDYVAHALVNGRWKATFDFDRSYATSAFDMTALGAVHDRLGQSADLRTVWADAFVSSSRARDITESNWKLVWCAQAELDSGYASCAGIGRRRTVALVTVAACIALLFGIVIFLRSRKNGKRTSI